MYKCGKGLLAECPLAVYGPGQVVLGGEPSVVKVVHGKRFAVHEAVVMLYAHPDKWFLKRVAHFQFI